MSCHEYSAEAEIKCEAPGVGHLLLYRLSDLATTGVRIRSQFLKAGWAGKKKEVEEEEKKILIGFWVIDGISSPQGENQNLSIISHFLKTTNWEQAGLTSVSAQLMRHVTLTNPSAALMGSVAGGRADGRTSALHPDRLNKHVHVRGERDHRESGPQ